jgi:ABC-type uncharacterized transport system auxiliary subunit
MQRLAIVMACFIGLAACSSSQQSLDTLAASGQIDETAPLKVSADIVIAAPVAKV